MRVKYYPLLLSFFVLACSGTKKDDTQLQADTVDHSIELASDDHSNIFFNKVLKDQLAFFEEEYMVDYMNTKKPDQFYRFILLPSHSRKTIVRITESQQESELVFKGTDFNELSTVMNTRLDTKALDSLNYYIEQSNFWGLDNKDALCDGADGAVFIIEASKGNNTNTLLRWSPGACKLGNGDAILKLSNYIMSLVNLRAPKDLSTY